MTAQHLDFHFNHSRGHEERRGLENETCLLLWQPQAKQGTTPKSHVCELTLFKCKVYRERFNQGDQPSRREGKPNSFYDEFDILDFTADLSFEEGEGGGVESGDDSFLNVLGEFKEKRKERPFSDTESKSFESINPTRETGELVDASLIVGASSTASEKESTSGGLGNMGALSGPPLSEDKAEAPVKCCPYCGSSRPQSSTDPKVPTSSATMQMILSQQEHLHDLQRQVIELQRLLKQHQDKEKEKEKEKITDAEPEFLRQLPGLPERSANLEAVRAPMSPVCIEPKAIEQEQLGKTSQMSTEDLEEKEEEESSLLSEDLLLVVPLSVCTHETSPTREVKCQESDAGTFSSMREPTVF